jgi:cytochrome c oxidase subunit II
MTKYLDLSTYMGLPILSSEHGRDMDMMMIYVHWLMIALFIGWLAYFAYAIFRFRQSRNPKADHIGARTHASSYVEVSVAVVEGFLLIAFAIPLWAKVADAFPPEQESTVIRVISEQFTWNSRYPGEDGVFGRQDIRLVSSANPFGLDLEDPHGKDDIVPPMKDIRVPVNKPVIIHLTSKDVVHSFKVLALRVTQDAIPGMSIPLHFVPTREGTYQIHCAQLCGNGHAFMNGLLTVTSQEEFDTWLASFAVQEPIEYE